MGWTYFNARGRTPADILRAEFTQTGGPDRAAFDVIDASMRGREWYALIRRTDPAGQVLHFGLVCLWSMRGGEFGYKAIDEACGPVSSRAPLRIIDALDRLAPIDAADTSHGAQWARAWRARCRANATKPARPQWAAGMRVRFSEPGRTFELIAPAGPRRGWHVQIADGLTRSIYRASAQQMARAVIV